MTTGVAGPFGAFLYSVANDSWWWSDELYRIHGFEPGEVVPSTALLVAHEHPEDQAAATAVVADALHNGEPFALWHRIVDARRRARVVVVVGDGERDERGDLVEVRGYMVDVTASKRGQAARDADEAVRRSAESRGAIEQAKGVLMVCFGLDEDEAFALLKRGSQHANVKLRELADEVMSVVSHARRDGRDVVPAVAEVLEPGMPDTG